MKKRGNGENERTKNKRRAAVLALTAALISVSTSGSELFAQEAEVAQTAQEASAAEVGDVAAETDETEAAEGGETTAAPEAEAAAWQAI